MTFPGMRAELSNWSKSDHSPCLIYPVNSTADIVKAMEYARDQHLPVIPHGAGHSYTDAALNTNGVIIDVRPMRRILSWDPNLGIMRVEPGATVRDVVAMAWKDGWWPPVLPSTPEVTMGGCAAMNVNGKNAWKYGSFGEQVLALDVLLPSGESRAFSPGDDPQLFRAFIGSLGLLGIITSITIQLQRISSGTVAARSRRAASLAELFALFAEEAPASDFMEAWLDGFSGGAHFGRGILTSAVGMGQHGAMASPFPGPGILDRLEAAFIPPAAHLARPFLLPGVRAANRVLYAGARKMTSQRIDLPAYTFWPSAAFAGYHALFPDGVETFQAFVPGAQAQATFARVLHYSQRQDFWPVWCVVKQHRRDPFLLSYQVDGFSLELNYPRSRQGNQALQRVLRDMIAMVIEAGGRFYLAKDHFQTHDQYCQSVGGEVMERFLQLKYRYDPDLLLQSDLYRRVFAPSHE